MTTTTTAGRRAVRRALGAGTALAGQLAWADCAGGGFAHLPQGPFVDAGDGLVRHVPTATVWKRCAEGQQWAGNRCAGQALQLDSRAAQRRVTAVNASAPGTQNAGQTSWRLPRLHELRALVETGCSHPAINQTQFPHTPALSFWTETPLADEPGAAWTVDFTQGQPRASARTSRAAVRLVRVHPGLPPELSRLAGSAVGTTTAAGMAPARRRVRVAAAAPRAPAVHAVPTPLADTIAISTPAPSSTPLLPVLSLLMPPRVAQCR